MSEVSKEDQTSLLTQKISQKFQTRSVNRSLIESIVSDRITAPEKKKSSVLTSIINLMNTVLGAGILALPFVLLNFGLFFGLLIVIAIYFMTIFSCKLLLNSKNLCSKADYSQIGISTFGYPGQIIIKVIIILNNLGMCISYAIIFGSSVSQILSISTNSNSFFMSRQFFQIIAAIFILPFMFAKSTEKLKFASFLSIIAIVVFTFITIYNFANKASKGILPTDSINYFIPSSSTFEISNALGCFSTVFLAFTFHFNFFPIYKSLDKKTDKKMMKVAIIALTIVVIFYILIAGCGYLSYGSGIKGNFLESFTYEDLGKPSFYTLYVCFGLSTLFSIPIFYFEARNYLLSLISEIKKKIENKSNQKVKEPLLVEEQYEEVENGNSKVNKNLIYFLIIF